ncbi:MAG: LacI family DNA-binding transcriptional regulator [Actinobacteria bacterium]|nr:LacI family DNA-binding transcriptional regulator [Actinomycetota bacterium]
MPDRIPGSKPPTIADVARSANVSVATVSNVLRGTGRFSAATRLLVESTISDLGYVPNRLASELRRQSVTTIGLVVPKLQDEFFGELAAAVVDAGAEQDLLVVVGNSNGLPERERSIAANFVEQRVRGAIIVPISGDSTFIAPSVAQVWVGAENASAPSVIVDEEEGGRLAGDLLAKRGCRRIAYVGTRSSTGLYRRLGVEDGFGRSVPLIEVRESTVSEGESAIANLGEEFDGIACESDMLAIGAIRRALRDDRNVPDRLAVVGHDNLRRSRDHLIPLTTIAQPIREIGLTAVSLLSDILQGRQRSSVRLHPYLIRRDSA